MGAGAASEPHRTVWRLPRKLESVPKGRHLITEHARRVLGDGDAIERLKLCASELLTNALEHGAGPDIKVAESVTDKVIGGVAVKAYRVDVHDDGGTGRIAAPGHDDLEARRVDNGRGLSLVEAVADLWGLGSGEAAARPSGSKSMPHKRRTLPPPPSGGVLQAGQCEPHRCLVGGGPGSGASRSGPRLPPAPTVGRDGARVSPPARRGFSAVVVALP